ncbi:hypothetical protein Vretifemale_8819, partial [Volvox reticuliferus]
AASDPPRLSFSFLPPPFWLAASAVALGSAALTAGPLPPGASWRLLPPPFCAPPPTPPALAAAPESPRAWLPPPALPARAPSLAPALPCGLLSTESRCSNP